MVEDSRPLRNYSVIQHCSFGVRQGDAAIEIATNLTNWFELGTQAGDDYWLEGNIVGGSEFLFNGRLFLPNGAGGTIIDNFPRNAAPAGWTKRQRVDGEGYELVSPNNIVLFGYRVVDRICHVEVNIYAADRGIVAESLADEFRIYRPPMRIGRGGIAWG